MYPHMKFFLTSALSSDHNLYLTSSGFLRNLRGGKGAEFAEYFRRNTCTRQILANICRLHVFFTRKCAQESRGLRKKGIFLLQILSLAFGFTSAAENLPIRW